MTMLAFVIAFAVTATVVFFAVLSLAGPHGGALPLSLHTVALAIGWVVVVAAPVLVARWVWRRLAPSTAA